MSLKCSVPLLLLLCLVSHGAVVADESVNMIEDVSFSTLGANSAGRWQSMQHAGEVSYAFSVTDEQLSIERVGPEPWGLVAQRVDAESLRGKKVRIAAELSGEFEEMGSAPFEASGLSLRVTALAMPGVPHMGMRTVVDEVVEKPLVVGEQDWKTYELIAEIPEDARTVEVSIRMTYDGKLQARNPVLTIIPDDKKVSE